MALDSRLSLFLARCVRFAAAAGIAQSTLSTKLFKDGKRLAVLTGGGSDVGIQRLAQAERDLDALELAFVAKQSAVPRVAA